MNKGNITVHPSVNRAPIVPPPPIDLLLARILGGFGAPALAMVSVVLLSGLAARAEDDPPPTEPLPGMQTEVAVTDDGRVNLHVMDLPLSKVLRLLSVKSRRNIIASPKVKGTVTANLYGVTIDEALHAILVANGAGHRQVGNFIYVYTIEELEEMTAAASARPITRVYSLNYVSALDAKLYIEPLLGKYDNISTSPPASTGLKSSPQDGGGFSNAAQDFIIVTARPEKLRQIEGILRKIDIRPKQVLIEATILRAELRDENALGIDFSIVGGVDLEKLGAVSRGVTDVTLGLLPQDRYERFNSNLSTDFAGDVPDGGITIGIIKDHVAVFLRALEQVTDTTVLANPKILALNKQKGQVIVGRRDGFLTTTVTETQAIQTVEFLETGTQLIFRPFIGDDGYIRMELHPEDSVGFVNAQGLPTEQTTEVTTNIIVRDGETILIGGLFREVTTDTRRQVPWLGGLPGIGSLFQSRANKTSREEVVILLSVHIVKDRANYAAASREHYEEIDRLRVGVRQGLMWHGRERVAQRHYHKATDAFGRGDAEKALWHLNMALHNHPRLLPAIQLKEQILEQREWDEEGSNGRLFLQRMIARERGYVGPQLGKPGPPFDAPGDSAGDVETDPSGS